ncbi:hypothetical protein GE061_000848 [Apolygus lucorum]|uniref:Uncharacterized protein n=1 Tax=Apolygus lucorum TaxID=248454 RepID=A0A8S9Y851_APOLU|nr:hypothetical protein GE061_000848 [Apolygus lucorum]
MPALGRRKRRGGKRRSIPSRATLAKRGIVMPGAYVARRGWLRYRTPLVGSLHPTMPTPPKNSNDTSCCELNCFIVPNDQVDGMACVVCKHFSFCVCKCASFKSKNGPYYSEQDRAATFHNWPHTAPTPVDLARAGFYYTGRFDVCRCAYCNIEVGRWFAEDVPAADHERWSPTCKFLRNPSMKMD